MQISDSKSLTKAIRELNSRRVEEEELLLEKMRLIKQSFDPAYQVNKRLPRMMNQAAIFNNFMDDSLTTAANAINNKLLANPTDSLLKQSGSNFLKLTVSKSINKYAWKIKIITLSLIKNIFS